MPKKYFYALFWIAVWFASSLFASSIKATNENCGKDYYIGYVLFDDLLCEVENKGD